MESKWRKARKALGLNLCVYLPRTRDDDDDATPSHEVYDQSLYAVANSPATADSSQRSATLSTQLSKSGSKSFKTRDYSLTYKHVTEHLRSQTICRCLHLIEKNGEVLGVNSVQILEQKTCAICLGSMKPGQGHALFTAECSHTFHFNCITSNVKHGNHVCPVCRAKWKEIPFQGPSPPDHPHGRNRVNPVNWPHDDAVMTILRRPARADYSSRPHHNRYAFQTPEPSVFDDDELLHLPSETALGSSRGCSEIVEIKTYPEFSAIEQSASEENFTILIHLKAPVSSRGQIPTTSQSSRAPVDLVTVLDVSGSMSGTKLALLKRAMGFVIQNLGPSDRLSVITFSTYAHRLFHLCRMSESGRQQALQAVNSLTCHGGTNIAEGLRKGAKVIEERKEKNPVCGMILLSDGQDTHPSIPGHSLHNQQEYRLNMPASLCSTTGHLIPVHAFGIGDDHDSVSMHTISENSGGTFSYIEAESVIQDAFAQCIGGILSVVVQEMDVHVESAHPGVHLGTIKSGSYASEVSEDRLSGSIHVGDLYAEEERDFLVSVGIPPVCEEMSLLRVGCTYLDPVSKGIVQVGLEHTEVKIQRPVSVIERTVSLEVDRQRNRLQAAEAMAEARDAAERGALCEAVAILENRRRMLLESQAWRAGDQLCMSLDTELKEIQERMASQQHYDVSGRAYVLSGLSSHSWQRATARSDSSHSTNLVQAYQTPSMVDMLQRSQTLGPPPRQSVSQPIRPVRSFNLRAQPR